MEANRAVAEENLVLVHSHLTMFPGDLGLAVIEVIRVEEGLITGHWVAAQSSLKDRLPVIDSSSASMR